MMLGVYTDFLPNGGIQRMARQMAAVQSRFCREMGTQLRLFSLNDDPGQHTLVAAGETLTFQGFGRDRRALVLSCLRHARLARMVYFNHPNLAPIGILMKCRKPTLPYQVHAHGIEVWKPLTLPRQAALRAAQLVTTSSKDTGERLCAVQRLKPQRLVTLYPAIEPLSHSAPAPARPHARRYFLSVSRLVAGDRYKGIDTTIQAFARFATDHPEVDYLVVGEGDDRPRLEKLADGNGLAGRVRFLSSVDERTLDALYRHCEFFVLPSAGEGLGIVFLEAMARGKACIGARAGGIPEAIEDGAVGLLCDPASGEELGRMMAALLSDPAFASRLGKRGIERVDSCFTFPLFETTLRTCLAGGWGPAD